MARPLRVEYPGAWYHVMNRGLAKQTIFHNDKSYQLFLDVLEESHNRYQIKVHAYCLMRNHFHLLIQTPLSNLGRAMRHIDGLYTVRNNRLIGRDGPLFRGRYKAIIVEAENYLLELSRYIHLNPCAAKLVNLPENYFWSSYNHYLNSDGPGWLYREDTLNYFNIDKVNSYKNFVIEGLNKKEVIFDTKKIPILGSENFMKKVQKFKETNDLNLNLQDVPGWLSLQKKFHPNIGEIVDVVASYFNTTSFNLLNNIPKRCRNRKIAIYLCSYLTDNCHKSIAEHFKGLSGWGVAKICQRIEQAMEKESQLSKDLAAIKKLLSNVQI